MRRTLLVLGLGGCLSSKPQGVQMIAAPTLTVVEDGDIPQRVVRIAVPVHMRQRAEEHIDTTNQPGESPAMQYPTVRMWSTYEVTDVAADGTMTVHVTADRATYDGEVPDPNARQALEGEVAALRRVDRTYRLAPSGVITKDGQGKLDAIMEVGIRFPDEPIGVGAEWRETSVFAIDGVKFNRAATYHLRSLDDAAASVEVEFVADAPPQLVEMFRPGESTQLTRGHAEGHGLYTIPLQGVVATGGGKMTTELALTVSSNGMRVKLAAKSEQQTTVKLADDATR